MVRFKVIKASKLLLYLAAGIFILVLAVLIARYFLSEPQNQVRPMANLVSAQTISGIERADNQESDISQYENEAKTLSVFASDSVQSKNTFPLDPGRENSLEIEIISETPPAASIQKNKRILIYHTHTHEAYEQTPDDPYIALEAWRTTDEDHSVVRIGRELKHCLEGYGFEVVHDTTDHEGDQLSTAYSRSLVTLESYDESFDLYIDLHRDAYIEGMSLYSSNGNDKKLAPLMILIGNGEGFEIKPDYDKNYQFAQMLTERINALSPGLCKDVLVKDGRYNQHVGPLSILVEVGHNKNTLEQAKNSIPYLSKAIFSLFSEKTSHEIKAPTNN